MKIPLNQPILTREERLKLHSLIRKRDKVRRKQNPTGRVAGISRIPITPEIKEFFADIAKKRQAEVASTSRQ